MWAVPAAISMVRIHTIYNSIISYTLPGVSTSSPTEFLNPLQQRIKPLYCQACNDLLVEHINHPNSLKTSLILGYTRPPKRFLYLLQGETGSPQHIQYTILYIPVVTLFLFIPTFSKYTVDQ
jgi:hypothetical protein